MNAFFDAQFEIVGPDRIQVFFDLELLWAFLVTWILGTLLLAVRLRLINAGALMFLKLIIVFVFFIFFYQPEWKTGGDDGEYFRAGLYLLDFGLDPIRTLGLHHMEYLRIAEGGRVWFYYFTYLMFFFLGPHYCSAILGSVLLSVLSALLLAEVYVRLVGTSAKAGGFIVIYSLHWITITWSSFILFKEPIIVFFISGILYGCAIILSWGKEHWTVRIFGIGLGIFCFFGLFGARYYMPYLFLGSVGGMLFVCGSSKMRIGALGVLGIGVVWAWPELPYFFKLVDVANMPYELLHFLLQPVPWKLTQPAGFLWIQSLINWLGLPLTLVGVIWLCWNRQPLGILLVVFGLVMAGFYSMVPDLASTRHRMPLDSLSVLCQLIGFRWLLRLSETVPMRVAGRHLEDA